MAAMDSVNRDAQRHHAEDLVRSFESSVKTQFVKITENLMEETGYDASLRHQYIELIRDYIFPFVEPTRRNGSRWRPIITHNGADLEPSWNVQNFGSKSPVRFSVEPCLTADDAASDFETVRRSTLYGLVERLNEHPAFSKLDLRWFMHAQSRIFTALKDASGRPKARIFLAFDLHTDKANPQALLKAYFLPNCHTKAANVLSDAVVYSTIRTLKLPANLSVEKPLSIIESYLSSRPSHRTVEVEMLAIDCCDQTKARVKVYGRSPPASHDLSTSFAEVLNVFTLGGAISPSASATEALAEWWNCLMGPSREDASAQPRARTAGILYGFEIKPGSDVPLVKVYIPLWHYVKDDTDAVERLKKFFRWGKIDDMVDYDERYRRILYVHRQIRTPKEARR
jgi:DMATS type aromatic prenyltransferase